MALSLIEINNITNITYSILSLLLLLPLFVSLVKLFCDKRQKFQWLIKIIVIVIFLSSIIFSIIVLLINTVPISQLNIFYYFIDGLQYVIVYLIYIILLLRVHYTFRISLYEINWTS